MLEQKTISELRDRAPSVAVGGYRLEQWRDGTYFIESPSGEGTQVPAFALQMALRDLFGKFF